MRMVSWNVKGNQGIDASRREAIRSAIGEQQADIVILQEVTWENGLHEALIRGLAESDLKHTVYGGAIGSEKKRYGNLIASRFPLTEADPSWTEGAPWPQSFARATVHATEGDFELIGVHVPNGSGNGWAKVETLEALGYGLARLPQSRPVLVAGDFNEPRSVLEDGTVIPFTIQRTKSGEWSSAGKKTGKCGRTFPRARWVRAVRSILGREPSFDLRHVCRVPNGTLPFETTHRVPSNGSDRFFDHILVSSHWKIEDAGFDHGVRESKVSDHSLAWADVRLRRR